MPARVFTDEDKTIIKEKLLSVGFPMLKEYGYIHMSIPKIAKEAGIATGTFYSFFKSKEEYIYQLIGYQRAALFRNEVPADVLAGKRKLKRDEVRKLILLMIDKEKSVYANLKLADEEKLFSYLEGFSPDIEKEKAISGKFLSMLDVKPQGINFPVVANLLKVLAISAEAKDELHAEGYAGTVEILVEAILNELL